MAISFLELLSAFCGWTYTLSWSLSFYPQPILNWRRQSTHGTTISFPTLNLLGFTFLTISTSCFLYSPLIRSQYAVRHHGLAPTVAFNDLVFAAHAWVMCVVVYSQFWGRLWGFPRDKGKRMWSPDGVMREEDAPGGEDEGKRAGPVIKGIAWGSVLGVLVVLFIVLGRHDEDPRTGWVWLDVINALVVTKLVLTVIKYTPQVITNFRNKSTTGWAIETILFDITGGVLSLMQLGIDSYLQGDWSGFTGNVAKLMLGNISIVFDVIFILQHYVIYRGKGKDKLEDGEEEALLGGDGRGRGSGSGRDV